jgi:hypothetical protein
VVNERLIGWLTHYATGAVYGLVYVYLVTGYASSEPSLGSALLFGLITVTAPWLLMQPAMGAGVFATRTQRPGLIRLVNLSMHTVFGASLYAGWVLIQ